MGSSAERRLRVLLVEDNPAADMIIQGMLREGHGVRWELVRADRLSTALERVASGGIDVVLMDLDLPDSRGVDTAAKMCSRAPEVPVVVLTALTDETAGAEAIGVGAQDYLVKGQADGNLLGHCLRYAIKRKQALREAENEVRTLRALLPVCSSCKKRRDDARYWDQVSEYLGNHQAAGRSQALCPECAQGAKA